MEQEIQKQNAAMLTYQRQPEQFLAFIGSFLETSQKLYRVKLPSDELEIWRETLKDYSAGEFEAAMTELITHPPKYQLEDGSIQVWRGMPKLPDVVQVMLDNREKAYQEYRRREYEREKHERERLEKRRQEHPEEFIGWKEFCDMLKQDRPDLAAKMGLTLPIAEIDLTKNAEKLAEQKEIILASCESKSKRKGDS